MNIKENYFNLNNKTIFVSGAYSFLGKSMCDGLGCYGANLILNGTNIEKLNKLKKYLSSKNIKCSIARFDITNYQDGTNGVLIQTSSLSKFTDRITFVFDLNNLTPSKLKKQLKLF